MGGDDAGARGPAPAAVLGDEEFRFLRGLLHAETGIYLGDGKRAFVAGRLARRLRELGLSDFAAYCRRVRSGADEHTALFDALCIHETRFFREPAHFEYLSRTLVPRWRAAAAAGQRSRTVRLWSAGCSTGEEAYSLAMAIRQAVPSPGELSVEVLATDLSTAALAVAQLGLYPLARAGELPEALLKAFMLRGRGRWEGQMRVGPEIRGLVRFERLNLHHVPYEGRGPFDAIFCRNVLIYFDAATRARVTAALLGRLAAGGVLFVGHAEGLHGVPVRVRAVCPSAYVVPAEEGGRG